MQPERPSLPQDPRAAGPDVTVPLRFVLAGLASLALAVALLLVHPNLIVQYHYHQHTVALSHLVLLGFVLSIVTGAAYQLVPVVLETQLYSERLARWHFPIHVISVAGMVWAFWVWDMKNVGHFGSGLAVGVGLLLWNLGRTIVRAGRWNIASAGMAASLVMLGLVVFSGLFVAAGKSTYELVDKPGVNSALAATLAFLRSSVGILSRFDPLAVLHAHVHLGILGVFVTITAAVAYRLVPMFLVSDLRSPRRAAASLALMHLGTVLCVVAILLQHPWKPAAAAVACAGFALYGIEMSAIVRQRRRRDIDWGLRGFLISQAFLLPAAAIGTALSLPGVTLTEAVGRLENSYGFLAVMGVLALAILSMLFKILPFLVWFAAYKSEVGRHRTPTLQEMCSSRVQAALAMAWIAGTVVATAGILAGSEITARAGAVLLAAAVVLFAVNAALILRHLVHPRLEPLPRPQPKPARRHEHLPAVS